MKRISWLGEDSRRWAFRYNSIDEKRRRRIEFDHENIELSVHFPKQISVREFYQCIPFDNPFKENIK